MRLDYPFKENILQLDISNKDISFLNSTLKLLSNNKVSIFEESSLHFKLVDTDTINRTCELVEKFKEEKQVFSVIILDGKLTEFKIYDLVQMMNMGDLRFFVCVDFISKTQKVFVNKNKYINFLGKFELLN